MKRCIYRSEPNTRQQDKGQAKHVRLQGNQQRTEYCAEELAQG